MAKYCIQQYKDYKDVGFFMRELIAGLEKGKKQLHVVVTCSHFGNEKYWKNAISMNLVHDFNLNDWESLDYKKRT